jgi:hypothetical protein
MSVIIHVEVFVLKVEEARSTGRMVPTITLYGLTTQKTTTSNKGGCQVL